MFHNTYLQSEKDFKFKYSKGTKDIDFKVRGNAQPDTIVVTLAGINHFLAWFKKYDTEEYSKLNNELYKSIMRLDELLEPLILITDVPIDMEEFNKHLMEGLKELCLLPEFIKPIVKYVRLNTTEIDESKTLKDTVGFIMSNVYLLNAFSLASKIAFIFSTYIRQFDTKLSFKDIIDMIRVRLSTSLAKELVRFRAIEDKLEVTEEDIEEDGKEYVSCLTEKIKDMTKKKWSEGNTPNFILKFAEIGHCVDNISNEVEQKLYKDIKIITPSLKDSDDQKTTFTPGEEVDDFKLIGLRTVGLATNMLEKNLGFSKSKIIFNINSESIKMPDLFMSNYEDMNCDTVKSSRDKYRFDIANNKSTYIMKLVKEKLKALPNRAEMEEFYRNPPIKLDTVDNDFNKLLIQQVYAYCGVSSMLYSMIGPAPNIAVLILIRFVFKSTPELERLVDIIDTNAKPEDIDNEEAYTQDQVRDYLENLNFSFSEQQLSGITLLLNKRFYVIKDQSYSHMRLEAYEVVKMFEVLKSLLYTSTSENRIKRVLDKNMLAKLGISYS